jgi:hypothetical protein
VGAPKRIELSDSLCGVPAKEDALELARNCAFLQWQGAAELQK